ncbi:ligase-associated DNA damage response exonuclease [Phaeovulum vinaykumarii]|uniref:Putative mRNA 3-end processing factor n=1 Tax=Phaeovulum vinaykumarii TaxID=407234 RepID=A0A1N7MHF9_9RHOB|nr:ligase-associated DNA damage response exonuclease [Phaeovulum vinaykumarii]SIS85480.1 putative mRNA 3-end processing factor [Phaeovulum vinaykumarii]SOC12252.1 putative mRNA 3-end processing factor [Phaeovulum vinaykumarii]
MDALLTLRPEGLYCPAADLFIDPWRPVARALVTHAHADHARPGHGRYLATKLSLAVMRHRLGTIRGESLDYGSPVTINDVEISFHPAGHVPGSAQIRLARRGEVWVVSGDYKTTDDGLSAPFAPLRCHGFVSECTFGLPVFRWPDPEIVLDEIAAWWRGNAAAGKASLIGAYALGKAQRLLAGLAARGVAPIVVHGAVEATNAVLRDAGLALPETTPPPALAGPRRGAPAPETPLVLAPPAALDSAWARRFGPAEIGFASGWMALRGHRRRRGVGRGFVLSDHVDWPGLCETVAATGAERVLFTHGTTHACARFWQEKGVDAAPLETRFGTDPETGAAPDTPPSDTPTPDTPAPDTAEPPADTSAPEDAR